jgi:hypothetical protein
MNSKLTRRSFLSFFLINGIISFFSKKAIAGPAKKALYWRKLK